MRLSAPRWWKQPLDGSRARTSRPPAPRGDAREASSIQASPMPRCVVDLELVARVALRRGSLWCWCPTRVYSRESECRRSCQASSTREPRWHLLSPAAISVDGCGSGGEFAQDCVDGNGGGAFRASAASWRFVRRRAVRRGRRKARRPRRCRETRSPAELRRPSGVVEFAPSACRFRRNVQMDWMQRLPPSPVTGAMSRRAGPALEVRHDGASHRIRQMLHRRNRTSPSNGKDSPAWESPPTGSTSTTG